MKSLLSTILFSIAMLCGNTWAVETCSRIAVINYQEVLVDTNSTEKGEGLRYHLEKDPKALSFLNLYQEGTQIRWQNAVLGTLGTTMMLGGVLSNDDKKKQALIIGGVTTMVINFLIAKTLDSSNEQNLIKSIEEYNKRNLPKIYFNPNQEGNRNINSGVSLSVNKEWSF